MAKASVLIGTSGWMYKHWNRHFYPKDVKGTDQLPYFAKHFDTVEINSTFYRLPQKQSVKKWTENTPKNFKFAVKLNNYLTHSKKLIIDEKSKRTIKSFFDVIKPIKEKAPAVLIQIQPSFKVNLKRLDDFLGELKPYGTDLDYCFEPRHKSWFSEDLYKILDKHKTGFVIGTYPGKLDPPYPVTGNVVYVRYHATPEEPAYTEKELDGWAEYIASLQNKVERIFVYFNNDFEGWAITNAQYLKKALK